VQKLLGISLSGLALAFLAIGSIGCQGDKKSSTTTTTTTTTTTDKKPEGDGKKTGEQKKGMSELLGVTGEVVMKKKESKDVDVSIKDKNADHDVIFSVKVMDKDDKATDKITGSGKIDKGATKGTLKLTTDDAPPGIYHAELRGDKAGNMVKVKIKVEDK